MTASKKTRSSRARKQTVGMRLIRLWVPDTRSPRFAAECRRQSRLLNSDPSEIETLDFIERVTKF